MKISHGFLMISILLLFEQCSRSKDSDSIVETDQVVESWISKVNGTNDGMELALSKQKPIQLEPDNNDTSSYLIDINEAVTYQEMDGFGASYTEASAYLMTQKLDETQRTNLLEKLFHKEKGIGISMIRQPIGASDHVLGQYDYASVKNDFKLAHFDISHDTLYKIPALKQSLAIHPGRIKVTCATWSPPAWMKTNNAFIGKINGVEGHLRKDCYDTYANYLLKFMEAYEEKGIPIYATSIQNEPDHASDYWPAMKMSSEEQSKLIKDHLGPLLHEHGKKIKIFCWDHNFNTPGYPNGKFAEDILKDTAVSKYVSGSAWHWYSDGFPEVLRSIHEKFPEKEMHFTEGSGGEWDPVKHWRDGFLNEMYYIVNLPRNYVKSIVWWNMALDQDHGPDYYYQTVGTHSTCRGLVTIDSKTGSVTYNVDYYTMGHISKFVDPGAKRIETNQWDKTLENVAFINPDGTKVLIVFNPTQQPKTYRIRSGNVSFSDTLLPEAAITYRWKQVGAINN